MLVERCLIILAVAAAAPPRRTSRSMMHLSCGEPLELLKLSSSEISEEKLEFNGTVWESSEILKTVKVQYRQAMDNYRKSNYDSSYERVRIGVHDHQYIPNWLPGQEDVNLVQNLTNATFQTIVNHLPKLYTDLQKFAVVFEELVEDESDPQKQEVLRGTQSYLMMLLCEVESILPSLQLPQSVERNIMSSIERNPADDTRRLIRDWGVLLKYRDYLLAWKDVFKY